jgi:hypothetical protein
VRVRRKEAHPLQLEGIIFFGKKLILVILWILLLLEPSSHGKVLFQRSRAKWLADGNRNARYYHLKTVSRRRRNNVIMLRDDQGEWIDDNEQLSNFKG